MAGRTVTGAGLVIPGAETTGSGTMGVETPGAGEVTEPLRAMMTSAVIAPPARTRHPAAISGLVQRRWWLAWRRKSSQGSARGCIGMAAGGSGTAVSTALGNARGAVAEGAVTGAAVARGAVASAPIRSRRERSSSMVKIWSESDSSTTPYNEALDPSGTASAYFSRLTLA